MAAARQSAERGGMNHQDAVAPDLNYQCVGLGHASGLDNSTRSTYIGTPTLRIHRLPHMNLTERRHNMRALASKMIRSVMPFRSVAIIGLLVLTQGCASQVDTVTIKPETCPLPQSLSTEDQNKVKNFAASISGLMSSLAGGNLQASVQSQLKRDYPDAADVNRIYALSYSACVSCRLDPTDVKGCAQRFDDIIETHPKSMTSTPGPAKDYRSKMLEPLRGAK